MKTYNANDLLKKYHLGQCDESELAIIESWYNEDNGENIDVDILHFESAKAKVWKSLPVHRAQNSIKMWPLLAIAASLILLVGISISIYLINTPETAKSANYNIKPGGNKAILKLANGKEIMLNDLPKGKSVIEDGFKITKTSNGQLIYSTIGNKAQPGHSNTIYTPNGGTFQVILSDGTKVWLNAASSLTYPTAFDQNKREVKLTGEGYFEVTHLDNQPFRVITEHQTVVVLGTHFNINAYADEQNITTTLLKGKVRIDAGGLQKLLLPNQQAKLSRGKIFITPYNADNAVDWVNNDFIFDNENLSSIMRKISRWYDVEVVYPSDFNNIEFSGSISREKSITQVLKIMERTRMVNFKVEGRRITVMQ